MYFSVQLVEPTGVTQEGVTQQYTKKWGSRGGSEKRGEVGSFCLGPSVFRTLIWYSDFSYCRLPQLGLSRMYHRELGVRGVFSVVCYAVLCPWSGGLSGLLVRFMPWSSV